MTPDGKLAVIQFEGTNMYFKRLGSDSEFRTLIYPLGGWPAGVQVLHTASAGGSDWNFTYNEFSFVIDDVTGYYNVSPALTWES